MKKTDEQKALDACIEYARANNQIKVLTREIGNALRSCQLYPILERERGAHGKMDTHLAIYYENARTLQDVAMFGFGSEAAGLSDMLACQHCSKADALIQQRKEERKKLGFAKRSITKLGKANQNLVPIPNYFAPEPDWPDQ